MFLMHCRGGGENVPGTISVTHMVICDSNRKLKLYSQPNINTDSSTACTFNKWARELDTYESSNWVSDRVIRKRLFDQSQC